MNQYWQHYWTADTALSLNGVWDWRRLAAGGRTVALAQDVVDAELATITVPVNAVLFNLGANDVGSLPLEATWKADAQYILTAMNVKWPDALVYITKPGRLNFDTECNTLAGWVDDLIALNSFCRAGHDERVWMKSSDNYATYSSDGTHYSDPLGFQEVAAQWVSVME